MTEKTYRTTTGKTLSDTDIERIASEVAEPGYAPKSVRPRGRPPLGDAPAELVPVRLDPALKKALTSRAQADQTTLSDVIRTALRRYLDAA